jgi:membrane protease YdiL (CAAX protease family)
MNAATTRRNARPDDPHRRPPAAPAIAAGEENRGLRPGSGRSTPQARRRRVLEAVAFVGVWMTLGYVLRLGSNAYLLLGIPLTGAFQLLVRRRPLRELFAADTVRFAVDRKGMLMAAVLAITPGYYATRAVAAGDWTTSGWYVAAMAGAVAAAFSVRAGSLLGTLRSAALPLAIGAGGMATVYGTVHLATGTPLPAVAAVAALAKYTVLYYPATFLLEEVAFRGAIDAHVHHEGDSRPWVAAVLVSGLWGVWHLPVSAGLPLPLRLLELVTVHVALGVGLSFAWRRARNLGGPALAHAGIDAVRNATMLGL